MNGEFKIWSPSYSSLVSPDKPIVKRIRQRGKVPKNIDKTLFRKKARILDATTKVFHVRQGATTLNKEALATVGKDIINLAGGSKVASKMVTQMKKLCRRRMHESLEEYGKSSWAPKQQQEKAARTLTYAYGKGAAWLAAVLQPVLPRVL